MDFTRGIDVVLFDILAVDIGLGAILVAVNMTIAIASISSLT